MGQPHQKALITVALANAGVTQVLYLSLLVMLPARASAIGGVQHRTSVLAVVASIGALVALAAAILAGRVADRLLVSVGSRRSVLRCGAALAAVALATLPIAHTEAVLLLVWCCAQLGLNGVLTVVTAALVDRFSAPARGRASAYAAIGQVCGALVASAVAFALPDALGLVGILSGLLLLVTALPAAQLGDRADIAALPLRTSGVEGYRDAGLAWTVRLVVTFANALVVTFVNYYVTDALRVSQPQRFVGIAAGIASTFVLLGAIFSGFRSDRSGRRRVYVICAVALMALGELVLAFWHVIGGALAGCAVVGFGYGTYLAVDQALTSDVLPEETRYGRDTGIMNAATTIPQIAAPALGALLINGASGYSLLFAVGAIVTASGSVFVLPIRSVR